MSNLDHFVKSSKSPPKCLATSQEIRDRASIFVGSVFTASTVDEARKAIRHLKHVTHGSRPATHEIAAWRCMTQKPGSTGLNGPDDFAVEGGSEDDGEKYGGGKVLKVMQAEGVIDAVVIVSRWYGGEMLGPARFAHIETCAREVCRTFRKKDDIATCLATLNALDDTIATLRTQLAALRAEHTSKVPQPDGPSHPQTAPTPENPNVVKRASPSYTDLERSLDVDKAKRLINARELSIQSLQLLVKKARDDRAKALDTDGPLPVEGGKGVD